MFSLLITSVDYSISGGDILVFPKVYGEGGE